MSAPTLYDDAVAAGIQHDSHESDLYLIDGPATRALIWYHGHDATATTFVSNIEPSVLWWDVPFAFVPYWRTHDGRAAR